MVGMFVVTAAETPRPITIQLSQHVCQSPCELRIRMRIEPHPDNRKARIDVEGPRLARGSEFPLEGDSAPRTVEVWYHGLPGGSYGVRAALARVGAKNPIYTPVETLLVVNSAVEGQ